MIGEYIRALLGDQHQGNSFVAIYSARLDESGTDEKAPYSVVAGAVATPKQWEKAESSWANLLSRSKVSSYHWKEFKDRKGDFKGWTHLKRQRFVSTQEKIIQTKTFFRASVGVDCAAHREKKKRLQGITGFYPESDCGLCFHLLVYLMCKTLSEHAPPKSRLTVMLEEGPWTKGALESWDRMRGIPRKLKPSPFAHQLAGISIMSKGECLSLEIADYLAGEERNRLERGRQPPKGVETLSVLLDERALEYWYKQIIARKEARRKFWRDARKASLGE